MSTHYYYDEEDEREARYDDYIGRNTLDDEWGCCFPGNCCMAFTDHMRDECHTPEMAAEWMSEAE